jgi:hypothetical protein
MEELNRRRIGVVGCVVDQTDEVVVLAIENGCCFYGDDPRVIQTISVGKQWNCARMFVEGSRKPCRLNASESDIDIWQRVNRTDG